MLVQEELRRAAGIILTLVKAAAAVVGRAAEAVTSVMATALRAAEATA